MSFTWFPTLSSASAIWTLHEALVVVMMTAVTIVAKGF
jgi:hypothetical protein